MAHHKIFAQELSRYLAYICFLGALLLWIVPVFPWWLPIPVGLLFLAYSKAEGGKSKRY